MMLLLCWSAVFRHIGGSFRSWSFSLHGARKLRVVASVGRKKPHSNATRYESGFKLTDSCIMITLAKRMASKVGKR